nr:hypothetical protein BaRGS_035001 [Batillaria attramentaria]
MDAVVFCHWDNILGPRLEHVWYISDRPQPHVNILRFITSQVLSGEICRELDTSHVDFKFFDIPDKGVLSYTALCPSCNLEQDFLQQAIASHLMTFGRSVVVGRVPDRVNKNKDGSYDLPIRDILYSKYPSSIIDVQKRDIRQSSSVADHPHLSHVAATEELSQLYNDRGSASSFTSMFQSADIPETLVKTLLDELHKLPVQNGIREAFVAHFMHLLQRHALTLIKHVEVETQRGIQPLRGGLKKLRHDLNLPLEGDLRIVVAAAEKLKPGLCHLVFGDRRHDADYLPNVTELL